jgi:hypothetical protein
MTEEIVKFALQAAIAIASAFLAAGLAARRFRNDRWWEKQATAYSDLIESLHNMKRAANEHYNALLEARDVPKEDSEKLWSDYRIARQNAWRIAESSTFIVSEKVQRSVQELEKALGTASNEDTWQGHLDLIVYSVDKCLIEVKEIGRMELKLKHLTTQ